MTKMPISLTSTSFYRRSLITLVPRGSGPIFRGFQTKTSGDIREGYLQFFEKHGHKRVESSSLVPDGDPTLMFTNSGMVQFKPYFLGDVEPEFSKVCSAQKCVRAGGKHNDLENVGFTPRHHTFFEMLGNFSFGDYFKEEAIVHSWEFITKELQLPKDKLRITVFEQDDESEALWAKVAPGVPIVRLGTDDNFWSMGDGPGVPCGPCTEIFFDQGGDGVQDDDLRWLEIWNLVFMQYRSNGSDEFEKLPRPCVDTGMGLERIASVMQGVDSNFGTDLLEPLVTKAGDLSLATGKIVDDKQILEFSKRVIADHIRASAFLVSDGVVPSNVGRGYVLRRIIRRAIGFGHKIGINEPFLPELLDTLEDTIGAAYPDLASRRKGITAVLSAEEEIFSRTLNRGFELLNSHIRNKTLTTDAVFQLYDTYGFPLDLTQNIAADSNITINVEKVEELMKEQRERSGAGMSWKHECGSESFSPDSLIGSCAFTGYTALEEIDSAVTHSNPVGEKCWVTIDPCPFYAEGGGQVSDQGKILDLKSGKSFEVERVLRNGSGGISLLVQGELPVGALVTATVDQKFRKGCSVHHTATHLMNAGLKKTLGDQVFQAGSYVTCDKLRFDFTHPRALSSSEIQEVEDYVNSIAQKYLPVTTESMAIDEAKKKNAAMLFGEKYGDVVRVVSINGKANTESIELCGGTHVENTSYIFPFKIISETSAAAGTRRIEAVSGEAAAKWFEIQNATLNEVCETMRVPCSEVVAQADKLKLRIKELEKDIAQLRLQSINGDNANVLSLGHVSVHTLPHSAAESNKATSKLIQKVANTQREKAPNNCHIIICGPQIACTIDMKDSSILDCESAQTPPHAGKLLTKLLKHVGGRGGGNATFAQGKIEEGSVDPQVVAKKMHEILSTSM